MKYVKFLIPLFIILFLGCSLKCFNPQYFDEKGLSYRLEPGKKYVVDMNFCPPDHKFFWGDSCWEDLSNPSAVKIGYLDEVGMGRAIRMRVYEVEQAGGKPTKPKSGCIYKQLEFVILGPDGQSIAFPDAFQGTDRVFFMSRDNDATIGEEALHVVFNAKHPLFINWAKPGTTYKGGKYIWDPPPGWE